MNPRVTVLLPVYNGERFLRQAIDSILNQSFADFELLIINDGSTDQTTQIIARYADARITYVNNVANIGLISTLNNGVKMARGELIARMDSDDIAHLNRLEKQVAYLDKYPNIDVLGCQIALIDHEGKETGVRIYPLEHHAIKLESLLDCPIPHPAVMFRKEKMIRYHFFYDNAQRFAEDYELWQRALPTLGFANLNEKLLQYRLNSQQVSNLNKKLQELERRQIRIRYLTQLRPKGWLDDDDCYFLNFLDYSLIINDRRDAQKLYRLLDEIVIDNRRSQLFQHDLFCRMIAVRLDHLVRMYANGKNRLLSGFAEHEWSIYSELNGMHKAKLKIKSWLK